MNFNITQRQIENNTVQTVNARELHGALGVGRDFSAWIKGRIEQYGLVKNCDYVTHLNVVKNVTGGRGGRRSKDYYISLEMAKIIAKYENKPKAHVVYNALITFCKGDISLVRDTRLELKFADILVPFCEALGVDVKTQVRVLNYRVDFLLGDNVLVEYDEKYHDYHLERDSLRQNEITSTLKQGGINPVWIRVKEGLEPQGLATIAKQLLSVENNT